MGSEGVGVETENASLLQVQKGSFQSVSVNSVPFSGFGIK